METAQQAEAASGPSARLDGFLRRWVRAGRKIVCPECGRPTRSYAWTPSHGYVCRGCEAAIQILSQ